MNATVRIPDRRRAAGAGAWRLLIVGALAVISGCTSRSRSTGAGSLVIEHVSVVDVAGGSVQPDMTVVTREQRIVSVEKSSNNGTWPGADIVDGRGKFLIPGLWDMHTHLSWTTGSALPVLVANGVTTVRDMGGHLAELDEWRAKIGAGVLVGPRVFRAGPILNGKRFNPLQMETGSPEQARGVVRTLKQVGVDFVKVHRRVTREAYFAIIEEAKQLGLSVVGHIPMTVAPEEASVAGQTTFEHTETLFEGTFSAGMNEAELPAAIARFRAEGAAHLFSLLAHNRTALTPTLVAYQSLIDAGDPAASPDPRGRYVAASVKKEFQKRAKPITAEELAATRRTFAELREVVRQLHRTGVTLLVGTDVAGPRVPGFGVHEELALLVDAGLTPLAALQAATLAPARLLNKAGDLATIEAGKVADLVMLDHNPLDDIRHTRAIAAVILGGKLMRRGDLDRLLHEGEELAKAN